MTKLKKLRTNNQQSVMTTNIHIERASQAVMPAIHTGTTYPIPKYTQLEK
jgi:hypothetical protein